MRAKGQKVQTLTLWDTPQQCPTMIQTTLSIATPRIGIADASTRSLMTGMSIIRPMPKNRDQRSGKVVLPLFWESTKEGALTYTDWRGEVEEYITKGYSGQKIKDVMFTSLEGKAKQNYQACDEKGDLPHEKILE